MQVIETEKAIIRNPQYSSISRKERKEIRRIAHTLSNNVAIYSDKAGKGRRLKICFRVKISFFEAMAHASYPFLFLNLLKKNTDLFKGLVVYHKTKYQHHIVIFYKLID